MHDLAIDGHAIKRVHRNMVTGLEFSNGNRSRRSISIDAVSRFGCQGGERFDGMLSPSKGHVFASRSESKQEEQEGAFFRMPKQRGARCAHKHENVHIQFQGPDHLNGTRKCKRAR